MGSAGGGADCEPGDRCHADAGRNERLGRSVVVGLELNPRLEAGFGGCLVELVPCRVTGIDKNPPLVAKLTQRQSARSHRIREQRMVVGEAKYERIGQQALLAFAKVRVLYDPRPPAKLRR